MSAEEDKDLIKTLAVCMLVKNTNMGERQAVLFGNVFFKAHSHANHVCVILSKSTACFASWFLHSPFRPL